MGSQPTIGLTKDKLVENKCKVTVYFVIFEKGLAELFGECWGRERIDGPPVALPLWTEAGWAAHLEIPRKTTGKEEAVPKDP